MSFLLLTPLISVPPRPEPSAFKEHACRKRASEQLGLLGSQSPAAANPSPPHKRQAWALLLPYAAHYGRLPAPDPVPGPGHRHCSHSQGPQRLWSTPTLGPQNRTWSLKSALGQHLSRSRLPGLGTTADFRFTVGARAVLLDSCSLSVPLGAESASVASRAAVRPASAPAAPGMGILPLDAAHSSTGLKGLPSETAAGEGLAASGSPVTLVVNPRQASY